MPGLLSFPVLGAPQKDAVEIQMEVYLGYSLAHIISLLNASYPPNYYDDCVYSVVLPTSPFFPSGVPQVAGEVRLDPKSPWTAV